MRAPSFDDILADSALSLGDDLRRTVAAWFAHLAHERGAADKTLEAYGRDLRQFLAWLKGRSRPRSLPGRSRPAGCQAVSPLHGRAPS